jgi:hypothetical protein
VRRGAVGRFCLTPAFFLHWPFRAAASCNFSNASLTSIVGQKSLKFGAILAVCRRRFDLDHESFAVG